jgi:predicted transcriptional regulator
MSEAKVKVQSWAGFKSDLLAAAKGEPAPANAGGLVVESVEALMRLLTLENRELLRIIRDERPQSVAALARMTQRAEPNLARTLGKLEAAGLVAFRQDGKRRAPVSLARRFSVHVDPFSPNDRIEVAQWTAPDGPTF